MSAFHRLGNKLRSVDFHTLGNKMKNGVQTIARKSVNTLAKAADIGGRLIPAAEGIATALGAGPEVHGLIQGARSGLKKIMDYHDKAKNVRNILHNV